MAAGAISIFGGVLVAMDAMAGFTYGLGELGSSLGGEVGDPWAKSANVAFGVQ